MQFEAVPCLEEELAATMQRALLPSRFPVRRDLEVEAAIRRDPSHVSFYDHLWLQPEVFAAIAVRVGRAGLTGAQEASALRQLIRALLAKFPDPAAVVEWLAVHRQAVDVAVAGIDVVSGAASWAMTGNARIGLNGRAGSGSGATLSGGDILWLTAGDMVPLADPASPQDSLENLVDTALMKSSGAGAGCAILFKAARRASKATTLVMANDQAGITPLLEEAGRFFADRALPEQAINGLEVALDEILTNCVNYGFRDCNRHEILVGLSVERGRLVITVSDDGAPFDPLSLPEPDLSVALEARQVGGLGMHFVRSLLDVVRYERRKGWNVLTLEKNLVPGGED